MKLLQLLAFFCYISTCRLSADVPTNDILENGKNIMEKLKEMSDAALDLYGELKIITMVAANTAKLAIPAANLGIAIANTVISPESDEAKMLKQLDDRISKNFIDLSHRVHYEISSAILELQFGTYLLDVNSFLKSTRRELSYVLEATTEKEVKEALEDYKAMCKAPGKTPLDLLQRIDGFVSCKRTVDESIQLYLGAKQVFHKLIKMTGRIPDDKSILSDDDGFGKQYDKIFDLLNSTQFIWHIQEVLDKKKTPFNNIVETRSFIDAEIEENFGLVRHDMGLCLVDKFLAANHWKTNAALGLAVFLERDIQLSFLLGSFCAGIAYETKALKKAEELKEEYDKMNQKAANRTLALLEATWPHIDIKEMENVIRDFSYSDSSTKLLEEKATEIWDKVNSLGPKGYTKHTIVTAFGVGEDSYTLKCDPDYCASYNSSKNEAGQYGLSAIVSRTPTPDYYIRATAQWSETNRQKIQDALYAYSTTLQNSILIGSVEHDVGPFVTVDHGHGYFFLRDWHYWAAKCVNWYAGVKGSQLPIHSNETLNDWRNGITTITNWTSGGIASSAVCMSLYIFA